MKMHLISSCAALAIAASPAAGALYTFDSGFDNGGVIPDANPSGWSDTRTLSGIAQTSITDLNVVLNLSGGYNGDLYGYLVYQATPGASAGTMAVLLNRVGQNTGTPGTQTCVYGFGTAGFANVTLDDQGVSGNIHNVANPTSGSGVSYTPDGGSLASFNGLNPNGTWTLFFADRSAGDQSTVTSWSLDITAVPEPTHIALGVFGGLLAIGGLVRRGRLRGLVGGGLGCQGGAMKQRLAQVALGRMLLHVGCMLRGGRVEFHWAGVRRELNRLLARRQTV